MESFDTMFQKAMKESYAPFPWQREFALSESIPDTVSIPTGLGKTAGTVLGWVWRRRYAAPEIRHATPRRLVYCLPMRVLVQQTMDNVETWLDRLDLSGSPGEGKVSVNILMGGEIDQSGFNMHSWDAFPEEDAVLIGTQDQLLSRVLNRGYSMSRFKWPVHFGLLNNDALWIIDETQLMGAGFPTTSQLNGLRYKLGTMVPCRTVWMSATLDNSGLSTVDNANNAAMFNSLTLSEDDLKQSIPEKRMTASKKIIEVLPGEENEGNIDISTSDYSRWLAEYISEHHRSDTLTIVMLNRVSRAQEVFIFLRKLLSKTESSPALSLLHSRFRKNDRQKTESLLSNNLRSNQIIITTQVLEAGVDVSARTLITELAPWSSMVQRFGRCNRYGEYSEGEVFWIDTITEQPENKLQTNSLPYTTDSLKRASELLRKLENVSPESLARVQYDPELKVFHIPRKRDILQLFDTAPDLMGFDLDVSRFIRDTENNDLQIFWREWDAENSIPPSDIQPVPEELCRVTIASFSNFYKKLRINKESVWIENHLDGTWRKINAGEARPGLVLLVNCTAGGYSEELGWTADRKDRPAVLFHERTENRDSLTNDSSSIRSARVTLAEHSADVFKDISSMLISLHHENDDLYKLLYSASLWHDAGKAHEAFQNMLGNTDNPEAEILAKSATREGKKSCYIKTGTGIQERPFFRHELASALWYLAQKNSDPLIAYLIAAHHGKVRMSIRSNPHETPPDSNIRYTCGIAEGDILPSVEIAPDLKPPEYMISLEMMELGGGQSGKSWIELVQKLLHEYGPFRLAYMEALLRTADWRASRKEADNNEG